MRRIDRLVPDQLHRLKLGLAAEYPASHSPPPVPS
jgi:hypothetical protein